MRRVIFTLVDSNMIDGHGDLTLLHHVAKPVVERTLARRVLTIVAFRAVILHRIGKTPRRRDPRVHDKVGGLHRNLSPRRVLQIIALDPKRVNPLLAESIALHVHLLPIHVDFMVLDVPVQTSSGPGLPLDTEGVQGVKVCGRELVHGADGIGLERLVLVS